MKSRLRHRIRKVNLDLDKQSAPTTQKNQVTSQKSQVLGNRQFGRDITGRLNHQHSQSQTSISLSQIKSRALERKRLKRILKEREDSPQSSVQNMQLASNQSAIADQQKLDIFSKIALSCQNVNDYLPQICQYLYFRDQQIPLFENVLMNQYEINQKMRMTLVDWIMRIHLKFKLKQQTLFQTIAILDNYTKSGQMIKKRSYQLLGVTSLYIACKYQQIYPPSNASFVGVCAKLYTFENILEMEGLVLQSSQFNIGCSTSKTHLQRLILMLNIQEEEANMARYLLELSLFNIGFYSFSPFTLALSAIVLIRKMVKGESFNLRGLEFDEQRVGDSSKLFSQYILNHPKGLQECIIYEKYSNQIKKISQLIGK